MKTFFYSGMLIFTLIFSSTASATVKTKEAKEEVPIRRITNITIKAIYRGSTLFLLQNAVIKNETTGEIAVPADHNGETTLNVSAGDSISGKFFIDNDVVLRGEIIIEQSEIDRKEATISFRAAF